MGSNPAPGDHDLIRNLELAALHTESPRFPVWLFLNNSFVLQNHKLKKKKKLQLCRGTPYVLDIPQVMMDVTMLVPRKSNSAKVYHLLNVISTRFTPVYVDDMAQYQRFLCKCI